MRHSATHDQQTVPSAPIDLVYDATKITFSEQMYSLPSTVSPARPLISVNLAIVPSPSALLEAAVPSQFDTVPAQ